MSVRASIVRIGNSRGIRIPRALLEECHLGDTVELSVVDGTLVVRPAALARQGWEAAFEQMTQAGDDALLEAETPTDFDLADWEWPAR